MAIPFGFRGLRRFLGVNHLFRTFFWASFASVVSSLLMGFFVASFPVVILLLLPSVSMFPVACAVGVCSLAWRVGFLLLFCTFSPVLVHVRERGNSRT